MNASAKHLMIVAGEASGDMHAAHLVMELQKLDSSLIFSGIGGPKMRDSGVEIYQDITPMAVVGFVEVIKHYPVIKKAFDLILNKIRELRPTAVILVDYPGFNLRLAKKIKAMGIKVIYYISPQVWAWKEKRVHQIKRDVNLMMVLFQFEKDFYARFGMEVSFVGHPLLDAIQVRTTKEGFLRSQHLQEYKLTVGILPGSRPKEVERHLPIMLEAAQILKKEFPMIQFMILQAPSIEKLMILKILKSYPLTIPIVDAKTYDGIHACDLCMVTSGTATLETAILLKPMVVIYKTSLLTWLLAKLFVKIPNIGLVNVVAGKQIVPECIQHQATGEKIAEQLKDIFTDEIKIGEIKSALAQVKRSLGEPGASHRAAEAVINLIQI